MDKQLFFYNSWFYDCGFDNIPDNTIEEMAMLKIVLLFKNPECTIGAFPEAYKVYDFDTSIRGDRYGHMVYMDEKSKEVSVFTHLDRD
jgi:hypothetical protein